jgi:hypothetical protein
MDAATLQTFQEKTMGLMFARRRAEDAKKHAANKAKAHAENHKTAKAAHEKSLQGAKPAEAKAEDAADKRGAK